MKTGDKHSTKHSTFRLVTMCDKLKYSQMEDEMTRFEAEISGSNAFNPAFNIPGFGNIPPPPTPPNLIPSQVRGIKRSEHSTQASSSTQPAAVVSAKPTLYVSAPQTSEANSVDFMVLQSEVQKKLKKLKEKVNLPAELAISQGRKASGALQSFGYDSYGRKGKSKKSLRTAGGATWEDQTLTDWNEDDFRIFCGDLGNDVTDELLTRTFNKYPSFLKARVVRDKRTNKTKGYGFVSFKDPADFTKAMKEMNGRYVGSRPIKLRKSTWKNRCVDIVRRKEREKAALISMLTSSSG